MTQIQAYALGYMYRQLEDLAAQRSSGRTHAENLDAAARRPVESMTRIQRDLMQTHKIPPHIVAALCQLYHFLEGDTQAPAQETALQEAISWSWLLGYCGCRCTLYDEACGMLYGRYDDWI